MNKIVLLAAAALLVGCGPNYDIPNKAPPAPENIKLVALGQGLGVYEVTLSDGTRCVTVSGNGIDCDWRNPHE